MHYISYLKRMDFKVLYIFLKFIVYLLVLAFLILIIAAIAYAIYRSIRYRYVRPFIPGHSEPFIAYMDTHIEFVNSHLVTLRNYFRNHSDGGKLKGIVSQIDTEGLIRDDLETFGPLDLPFHHIYFAFRKSTKPDSEGIFIKMSLNMIRKFYPSDMLPDDVPIYNISGTEITEEASKLIKKKTKPLHELRKYFEELDCTFRGFNFSNDKCKSSDFRWCKCKKEFPDALSDPNAEMARLHLMLLMYKYTKQIDRGYNLRKSGGIGNFTVFNIYMSDYAQYVFVETIGGSWKRLVEDFKKEGAAWIGFFTSPSTRSFMMNLPIKLGGGSEGFTNDTTLFNLSFAYDDTEEHFIGVLKSIGKVFVDLGKLIPKLFKLITSMVNVITKPLEFITRLIGWILGVILLCIYILLVIVSPLFIGVAAVWVALRKTLLTIIYTFLFVVIATIYIILWILDFATNGFILSLLRCENLPNAWHERAGWAFGSYFKRQFFCHYPCHYRYVPDGGYCKRLDKLQPSFCPQQLAFNAYISKLRGDQDHPSYSKGPSVYMFEPPLNYSTMRPNTKASILSKFFTDRMSFKKECNNKLVEYDFIIRYLCKNMDTILGNDSYFDKEKLKAVCKSCYCGHYFKDGDCKMKAHPAFLVFRTQEIVNDPYHVLIDDDMLKQINNALNTSNSSLERRENEKIYLAVEGYTPQHHVKGAYLAYPETMPSYCNEGTTIGSIDSDDKKKGEILYMFLFMMLVLVAVGSGLTMLYMSTRTPVIVD